jgi:hypothetical protein
MSVDNYEDLKRHIGHRIVCSAYGNINDPANVAIECETCFEIIISFDKDDEI